MRHDIIQECSNRKSKIIYKEHCLKQKTSKNAGCNACLTANLEEKKNGSSQSSSSFIENLTENMLVLQYDNHRDGVTWWGRGSIVIVQSK